MAGRTAPPPYFLSLPAHDRTAVLDVGRWRWIASSGFDLERPIRHARHQQWIAKPGHLHTPAHREIQLVLSGSALFSLNRRVYQRSPGTLFLFNHHEARDWVKAPHSPGPITALWLHLLSAERPTLTYNTVAIDAAGHQTRDIAHRIHTGEPIRALSTAWDQHQAAPTDRLLWEILKSRITTLLLDILQNTTASTLPLTEAAHAHIIQLACHYITDHLGSPLSLQTLARITGYSPFFLHRLFHRHTGQTPREYISHLRLQRALELLARSYTLEAIAEETGFSTPYAFSRFFKQQTGYAPKVWRATEGSATSSSDSRSGQSA